MVTQQSSAKSFLHPTSANNTVTTNEDIAFTFNSSDFAFADQDPTDSLVAVRI